MGRCRWYYYRIYYYKKAFIIIVFFSLIIFLIFGIFCYFSFYYKSSLFGKMITGVKTDEKIIALTFDDGPNGRYTEDIGKVIESFGGKATFFMVGKNASRHPNIVNAIYKSGHEIGIHSYSHQFRKYFTDPLFNKELADSEAVMTRLGIENIKYFRFPWLYRNPWIMRSVKKRGYKIISGEFAHGLEPFQVNHERIFRHSRKIVKPGNIIIFHDGYNDSLQANRTQTLKTVKLLCKYLEQHGYRMVTISELIKLKNTK